VCGRSAGKELAVGGFREARFWNSPLRVKERRPLAAFEVGAAFGFPASLLLAPFGLLPFVRQHSPEAERREEVGGDLLNRSHPLVEEQPLQRGPGSPKRRSRRVFPGEGDGLGGRARFEFGV